MAVSIMAPLSNPIVTSEDVFEGIDLGTIAYENIHSPVFHAWLNYDIEGRRDALRDRYVFFSVCCSINGHLGELKKIDFTKAGMFVQEYLGHIEYLVEARISFTEEWYKGIEQLIGAFSENNFVPEARTLVAIGLRTGVAKFPRIAQTMTVHAAFLDALIGRREKAAKVALQLIRRPFLLPNRRELPALCYRLMYILAAGNRLREYRLVLWTGVTHLSANQSLRDAFATQIVKTYRGTFRAMINSDVPLKYRLPFFLISIPGYLTKIPGFKALQLDAPIRWAYLATIYLLDRVAYRKNELFKEASRTNESKDRSDQEGWLSRWRDRLLHIAMPRKRKILVTRAMGGLGDLLMMTPGLQALRMKYPDAQIDFAVPKSFHAMLEGFDAVRVLDIDNDPIDLFEYKRWINLTDCPAGRIEGWQAPNVRRNRIEVFAKAMGISKWRLRKTAGFLPFYHVKDEESEWALNHLSSLNEDHRPVIGIQPFAADTYRNWPYMEQLVSELARSYCVLVFHHEPVQGFDCENVHKIVQPLRKSIALLSKCEKLVVLDSSLLHFSAALKIPTVAIFGAISGRLRTKDYPNVVLLAPKKQEFPCYPCWRHEHKPCHLTNGRESICFRAISVDQTVAAAERCSPTTLKRPFKPISTAINWVRYGRD